MHLLFILIRHSLKTCKFLSYSFFFLNSCWQVHKNLGSLWWEVWEDYIRTQIGMACCFIILLILIYACMFCGESYTSLQNLQILIKCDILGTSVGLERQCLVACTTNYKMNNVMVNLLLWTTLILRYLDPDFGSWIWNLVLVSSMQIQFLANKCSLHFPVVL